MSALFAPLAVGSQVEGVISLQNLDRKDAFSDDDLRLLTRSAASLSVALQNARLVDETRRRASELGDRQPDRPGGGDPARRERAHRARRRADPRGLRRRHRLRRPARSRRPAGSTSPTTSRTGAPANVPSIAHRRGADVADPAVGQAAAPQPRTSSSRSSGRAGSASRPSRTSGVPIMVGDRGHRRHQRPEHRGGGPLRRGRRPAPLDDRRQRRDRHPERPPLRRRCGAGPTRWPPSTTSAARSPRPSTWTASSSGSRSGRRRSSRRIRAPPSSAR